MAINGYISYWLCWEVAMVYPLLSAMANWTSISRIPIDEAADDLGKNRPQAPGQQKYLACMDKQDC